jgi:hypothetical protein
MATFTDVYKQELKSKGVLSSLGSTMFKRSKERLDPRNILFGGSGITSAIGQKIFGKGYSALNKSSSGKSLGDSGMQSQALNALIISSKNQEAQLSIIAKNTMNSNAMARDMNVMRQNIMKLVTMEKHQEDQICSSKMPPQENLHMKVNLEKVVVVKVFLLLQ